MAKQMSQKKNSMRKSSSKKFNVNYMDNITLGEYEIDMGTIIAG